MSALLSMRLKQVASISVSFAVAPEISPSAIFEAILVILEMGLAILVPR